MQSTVLFQGHKIWIRFIILSILIGFLLTLFFCGLNIKRTMRTGMPLYEYKSYMDKRIPALMKDVYKRQRDSIDITYADTIVLSPGKTWTARVLFL